MIWRVADRAHPVAVRIADRHYNRQHPGSPQFVPPGRCFVLVSTDNRSVWVTSWPFAEYVKHEWPGAWVNSIFRREGGELRASEMIVEAIAATLWKWKRPPPLGLVTFVDPRKVRHKRDPGRCYIKAGFKRVGMTKGGLIALQMAPDDMPRARAPINEPDDLFAELFTSSDEVPPEKTDASGGRCGGGCGCTGRRSPRERQALESL